MTDERNPVQNLNDYRHAVYAHIKVLVPVWVQSLLDHTGGVCLLSIDCDYCEGVGQPEYVALGQTIGRDDYEPISVSLRHSYTGRRAYP